MTKKYISEFKVGDTIDEVLYVRSNKVQNYKSKPGCFLTLMLTDRTGNIVSKLWDFKPEHSNIPDKSFIRCVGEVVEFAESAEIHIHSYELIDKAKVDPRDFLPVTPLNVSEMQQELCQIALEVNNQHLKKLLCQFIQDEDLFHKFCSCPAAKVIHQAYVGGLLEHCLKTAKIVGAVAAFYPAVNRDLAITGALLHDVGKIGEYDFDYSIEITDEGRLLGHIVLGLKILDNLINSIPDFPKELRLALHHIITSHHGKYEWQSPKRPKTIEALLIHYADALEADMWKFSDLMQKYRTDRWSPWERSLERYVFVDTSYNTGMQFETADSDGED